MVEYIMCLEIPANCPYLKGTVPILTLEKGGKMSNYHMSLVLQKSVCCNV